MTVTAINLADIRADTSAQPRTSISTDKAAEYAERMTEGDVFPPLVVFSDGKINWLADGFHRYHAAIGMGLTSFPCDVRQGGLRDAVLYSCGANAAHGVPRTNEDKRRAVMKLITDAEWSLMPMRAMARHCAVAESFVRKLYDEASAHNAQMQKPAERTVTRNGKTYVQNTAAIGKRPPPPAPAPAAETPAAVPMVAAPTLVSAINPDARAQHKRDLENSFVSAAIWEIRRRIGDLPAPEDAAERFPMHHRHTITKATLFEMAEWLRQFGEAFIEENLNVAAHPKETAPAPQPVSTPVPAAVTEAQSKSAGVNGHDYPDLPPILDRRPRVVAP